MSSLRNHPVHINSERWSNSFSRWHYANSIILFEPIYSCCWALTSPGHEKEEEVCFSCFGILSRLPVSSLPIFDVPLTSPFLYGAICQLKKKKILLPMSPLICQFGRCTFTRRSWQSQFLLNLLLRSRAEFSAIYTVIVSSLISWWLVLMYTDLFN